MISLEIKRLWSPDIELWRDLPPLADIYFLVQIDIGERGDDKQDIFQLMVVTPEALRARSKPESIVLSDRATLVISELRWKTLIREIERIVNSCNASTWSESVLKLQRYFSWEYEDYVQA